MESNHKDQIWLTLFTFLPALSLSFVAKEIAESGWERILYSAILCGLGGMVGYAIYYFTRNFSSSIRVLAILILFLIPLLGISLIKVNPSDAELIEQEWITQQLGNLEFEAPEKLVESNLVLPDSLTRYYSNYLIYADEETDRLTYYVSFDLTIDTLSREEIFSTLLSTMLSKLHTDITTIESELFSNDENELSLSFSIKPDENLYGFGYMTQTENHYETLWLIPNERGFSEEYIEEFYYGIFSVE